MKKPSDGASAPALALEELNAAIKDAEDALVALSSKTFATVVLSQGGGKGEPEWTEFLAFGKVGQTWMLTVDIVIDGDEPWEESSTALLSASLETRVAAVKKFPELFDALRAELEKRATAVQEATRAARDFASLVRSGAPK